jgi:hypothetical protein
VCLICHSNVALAKKRNVEKHFKTVHKKYEIDFPAKSELGKRKVKELKSQLAAQQSIFSRPSSTSKAARIASFWVSRILEKHKKPFPDLEMVKEAFF